MANINIDESWKIELIDEFNSTYMSELRVFLKKRITFWLGRVLGLTNHVMQKKSDLSLKSWVAAPVKMSGFCLSRGSPRILRLHHVYTMYIYMQNQGCHPRFQKFFGLFFISRDYLPQEPFPAER